jgi:hypothetical protein
LRHCVECCERYVLSATPRCVCGPGASIRNLKDKHYLSQLSVKNIPGGLGLVRLRGSARDVDAAVAGERAHLSHTALSPCLPPRRGRHRVVAHRTLHRGGVGLMNDLLACVRVVQACLHFPAPAPLGCTACTHVRCKVLDGKAKHSSSATVCIETPRRLASLCGSPATPPPPVLWFAFASLLLRDAHSAPSLCPLITADIEIRVTLRSFSWPPCPAPGSMPLPPTHPTSVAHSLRKVHKTARKVTAGVLPVCVDPDTGESFMLFGVSQRKVRWV